MASDDPKSTIQFDAETRGAESNIKGLAGLLGGLFDAVRSGSGEGVGALGAFSASFPKMAGAVAIGVTAATAAMGAIGAVAGALWSGVKAIGGFIGDSIAMNASLESTTLQFETLMGSADLAQDHVKFLFEFAKKTPFETGPIIEASKQFQVFGGTALNTQKNLLLVGDAAAATNKPINEIATWTGRLYSSLQAGKPFGEAAQRLGELAVLAPKARNELEAMQKAGKSGQEIFARYQEELGKFSGAMDKQAGTWSGLTSTISDTISILGAQVFAPFFDMAKTGLKAIADFLGSEGITNAAAGLGRALGGAFTIIKETIGPVISGLFQAGLGAVNAANGAKFYEGIVKVLVNTIAFLVEAFASHVQAGAVVVKFWYDLRALGNEVAVAFWKVVEGILIGTKAIADGMAKISFGETRKSFERDSLAIAEKLAAVRAQSENASAGMKEMRESGAATSKSMNDFADKLRTAAGAMREKAATYKYTIPLIKESSAATVQATMDDDAGAKGADALGKSKESLAKKITALAGTFALAEKNGVDFNKVVARNATEIKNVVEEAEIYGIAVPESLKKAYAAMLEADASKKMRELSENIAKATLAGADLSIIIEKFGNDIKSAVLEADAFGREVPEDIRKIRQAMIDAELDKAFAKTMGEISEINRSEWDKIAAETEKKVKDSGKAYDGMKDIVQKAQDDALLATKKGLEKQLAEIDIKQREEIKKLGTMPPEYGKAYEAAKVNVVKKYEELARSREEKQKKEIEDLAKIGPTYGEKYEAAKTAVIEKYKLMAAYAEKRRIEEIAGLGPIPEEYRKAYDGAVDAINHSFAGIKTEEVKKSAKEIRDTYIKNLDEIAKSLADLAQISDGAWGSMAQGASMVVGAISTAEKSIDSLGSGWKGVTGAFKGGGFDFTSLLSGIGGLVSGIGGIISAAQIAYSGLKKLFGVKEDWQKIADDVTHSFGVKISEGLAKEIDALAKTIEGGTKKQRQEIAESLSLSKIIAEGGGLNDQNAAKYTAQANSLFAEIAKGGKTAGQAQSELNNLIGQFGEHIAKSGGLADETFLRLIANAKATGKEFANVTAFIDAQNSKLVGGVAGMVQGTITSITQMNADYIKIRENEISKGVKDYRFSESEREQISKDANANIRVNFQEEFDKVSRITLASFNAMVANGRTSADAIQTLDKPISDLRASAEKFGLAGSEAFDKLIRWRDLVSTNKEVIGSIGSLNDIMVALHNTGQLDIGTFKDLQSQAAGSLTKLTESGFTTTEAYAQIKPFLETAIKLQKEHGFAIDETTQRMIDEARQAGVLGKEQFTAQEKTAMGMDRVANAIEFMAKKMGFIPPAAEAMADGVEKAADRIKSGIDTKVGGSIDAVSKKTTETPWESWANRGDMATLQVERGIRDKVMASLGKLSAEDLAKAEADLARWGLTGEAAGDRIDRSVRLKVSGSIKDADADLLAAKWETYAVAGINAGSRIKSALGEVQGGIGTMSSKVSDAKGAFDDWAGHAVRRVREVADEVNHLSFGHSPGGLKEFRPMLVDAMGLFDSFSAKGVRNVREVKKEVDSFTRIGAIGTSFSADITGSRFPTANNTRQAAPAQHFGITVPVTIHAQSLDPLTLMDLTDQEIGPRIAETIRLNINDMFTRIQAAQATTPNPGSNG